MISIRIAPQSLKRVKAKLHQMTQRHQGRTLESVRDEVNRYLVGWVNYYALADARRHLEEMDQWLRRRLRQMRWKQWKTSANRQRNLRAMGVSDYWAKRAGGTSKGIWRLSNSPPLHHAMDNAYWRRFGLKSFLDQYLLRHT